VSISYAQLSGHSSENVAEPDFGTGNEKLWATLTMGDTFAEADFATAEYDVDYRVVDLAVAQHFQAGAALDIQLIGGLRYG